MLRLQIIGLHAKCFIIDLWEVYGECKNYNILEGHKNAVLEVHWPTKSSLVSCSADKTVAVWDANKGIRTRRYSQHTAVVNSCSVSKNVTNTFASGSDDCTCLIWDQRSKYSVHSLQHDYPILSVCMNHEGTAIYTAGIDNIIR